MRPVELQMQGGNAKISSQGIAGKMRSAGLWYDDVHHSVVDGDTTLEAHRRDIETLGKKANFFGNISRYAWAAALPALGAFTVAVGAWVQPALLALGPAVPTIAAAVTAAGIIGLGFWASQRAETVSVSKQFEANIVNARTTANEIAKQTEKAPTVVVTQNTPRSEARETKWVNKVGHQETANKNSYVERYAPQHADKQASRAETVPEVNVASIA